MIRFENVTARYSADLPLALGGVSFDIAAEDFVFLVGASGSGKSTVIRLISREIAAASGQVYVQGTDITNLPQRKIPKLRRDIGVVFQDFRLLGNKTVRENVAFVLEVLGTRRRRMEKAVEDTLEMVGLSDKAERLPHSLSGGEQQRVAIARALVKKPAIILADEPTGNLDPDNSESVMQVLELISRAGTTLVMATHDREIVNQYRKRVIALENGLIVRDAAGGYAEGSA